MQQRRNRQARPSQNKQPKPLQNKHLLSLKVPAHKRNLNQILPKPKQQLARSKPVGSNTLLSKRQKKNFKASDMPNSLMMLRNPQLKSQKPKRKKKKVKRPERGQKRSRRNRMQLHKRTPLRPVCISTSNETTWRPSVLYELHRKRKLSSSLKSLSRSRICSNSNSRRDARVRKSRLLSDGRSLKKRPATRSEQR